MKKEPKYPVYQVNETKKAVSCKIKTRGRYFIGVAKCCDSDEFDVQKGKDIAYNRCRLEINKFVLKQEYLVRDTIQDIIDRCNGYGLNKERSKAWDDYLDDIKRRIKIRKHVLHNTEHTLNDLLK